MVCNLGRNEEHVGIVSGRRDRIQFEAAVLVGSSSRIVSILFEKKKFVVVSATPSGTQDPMQVLGPVSE